MAEQLVFEQPAVCEMLHISRATYYRLIAEGKLPHIRLGRKVFITKAQLEQLLSGKAADNQKPLVTDEEIKHG